MTGELSAARSARATQIEHTAWPHDKRPQALDQLAKSYPVHEIRVAEVLGYAVESSLDIAEHESLGRPDHVSKHRFKVTLQAKSREKASELSLPLPQTDGS